MGDKRPKIIQHMDLLTEIFVRLPVKTLLRLKSVCKTFLDVISKENPSFSRLRSAYHNENYDSDKEGTLVLYIERPVKAGLLHGGIYSTIHGIDFPETMNFDIPMNWGYSCEIMGSVDGLLWINKFQSRRKKWETTEMVLCNPSIRKCLTIPQCPACRSHPDALVHVGFGYDLAGDDYKAVVIVLPNDQPSSESKIDCFALVEVYSLKSGSWKIVDVDLRADVYLGHKVYFNGAIHWVGGDYDAEDNAKHLIDRIVEFNLTTESFVYKELPNCEDENPLDRVKFPIIAYGAVAIVEMSFDFVWIWSFEKGHWDDPFRLNHRPKVFQRLINRPISNAIFIQKQPSDIVYMESDTLLISLHGQGLLIYDFQYDSIDFVNRHATYVDFYVESMLWRELLPPSDSIGKGDEE